MPERALLFEAIAAPRGNATVTGCAVVWSSTIAKEHTMTLRSLAFCIALAAGTNAQANLLVNGSFEQGAFVNQANQTMSLAPGSTVITSWTVLTDARPGSMPATPSD
jgi:hypothetical protein